MNIAWEVHADEPKNGIRAPSDYFRDDLPISHIGSIAVPRISIIADHQNDRVVGWHLLVMRMYAVYFESAGSHDYSIVTGPSAKAVALRKVGS